MYAKGHIGLTLLLVSLLMLPFGENEYALYIIFLSAGLSALPDLDMEWQKHVSFIHHRGITHSILFAVIAGFAFGLLFYYTHQTLLWAGVGFTSGFLGVVCHLIGDIFTYHAFKPLWPLSEKEISFGLCRAGNRSVNEGLMTVGGIVFIAYFLFVSGNLSSLLAS